MTALDKTDSAIVNAFQGGFPVVERPFEPASRALTEHGVDIEPGQLCERIQRLVETDVLSRFGTSIDANAIGGATTLVALSVPADRFEAVAETVNGYREVAHNYERDHELNMWFVLSVVETDRIPEVLDGIERETGLETYNLPKHTEFDLGATFPVEGPLAETAVDLSYLGPSVASGDSEGLDPTERELIVAVQDGVPLTETPYQRLASELDVSTEWVVRTIHRFLDDGILRRVGVIPNHYSLGYTENPMTVWDVPDGDIDRVGRAVGSLPFVTHCYERPRHDDIWPYNLFAMVHGRSGEEASRRVDQIRTTIESHCGPVDTQRLESTRILKKTGLRIAERTATQ